MSEYNFEEINERHLSEVLEIYNYYALNTTATFHAHALSTDQMRELVFFENPGYKTFVINKDGSICGYAVIAQHKNREAYDGTAEVMVYLKPDYIGKGLGSSAIRYIEEYAKSNAFHVLLAVICGENDKSIKLFEKNGYTKCAHYKEVGKKFDRFLDVVSYQKII